jgi:hypothetical protein
MNYFAVTFKGFGGFRSRTVRVRATSVDDAKWTARDQTGWFAILSVTAC